MGLALAASRVLLVTFKGGGHSVVPNNKLTSGGGQVSVTVNYALVIQAVDTQTGLQFLAKRKNEIVGLVNNVFAKKGVAVAMTT